MTHRPEENYPEEVRIKLDKDQCLDVDGPESHLTFVITGMQLNKIFILYQEGLFYWNIRKFLKHGSRINKRITETIIHSPETFYYLNNGISAFCNSFEFNQNATELIIKKLQIVNGAQTIGAIGHINVQEHFSELSKTQVLMKLTAVKETSNEKGLAGAIIRSNNTHNLITPTQKEHWENMYKEDKEPTDEEL